MSKTMQRSSLGRGDIVSIVGETEDSEWGSGLARAWAQVHGHSGDGWYSGVLEDGSPVEFHEDQVEGLLEEKPSLSGIRDWFGKKKPEPGPIGLPALPQDPGGSIIYVGPTGVARYEEAQPPEQPKGFLNTIKASVASMVDAFKGATGLAPRPETPMTPYEKKPSMFAAFAPDARKPLQEFQERATSFAVPKGPGPLAPFVESAKELFNFATPSPEPESFEARTARQHELWTGMFQETKEGPSLFEAFKPSEVIMPEDAALPPEMRHKRDSGKIDATILPLPPRITLLPTPEDVARGLLLHFDPIDQRVFDEVRKDRLDDFFQAEAADCRDTGEPGAIPVEGLVGSRYVSGYIENEWMAIAALLQIPWEDIEARMEWGREPGSNELVVINEEEINEEIFYPAKAILTQAFGLIKPDDLKGEFIIDYIDTFGATSIFYEECDAESERAPGEGPGEAFEEDAGESFGEGEAAEQEEDLFYEAPIVQEAPKKKPKKKTKKAKKAKKK